MKLAHKLSYFSIATLLLVTSILFPAAHYLIWIAFAPFLLLIKRMSTVASLLSGLLMGIIVSLAYFYWIAFYEMRILGLVVLTTAPFLFVFAVGTNLLLNRCQNNWIRILSPSVVWSAVSFLYRLTPLKAFGDQISAFEAPLFPVIVSALGISAVSFAIILVNTVISYWWTDRKYTLHAIVILGSVAACWAAGHLDSESPVSKDSLKVACEDLIKDTDNEKNVRTMKLRLKLFVSIISSQ